MPTLNVNDFSCLKEASFTLSPVNVIIGPQGSGKSVTTKLLYFCSEIIYNHIQSAEREISIEDFKKLIAKQFAIWFPPAAWGSGRFNISYVSGYFSIRILRRVSQGRPSDEVSITFSEWFTQSYNRSVSLFSQSMLDSLAIEERTDVDDSLDKLWKTRDVARSHVQHDLKSDYISSQTFIPAGRSFFTTLGRLVAGLEQASSLDPITIKFARLFAGIRDRNAQLISARSRRLGKDFINRRRRYMNEFFGGELKFERDLEFVHTNDGRRIPFPALSSGQQELLPMWSIIDYYSERDIINASFQRARGRTNSPNTILYIEEPEAHLFPSAQGLLMDFLISSIMDRNSGRSIIITTHSPYIMAKLNVFLKAGHLSRRKKKNSEINDIVSRDCWIFDGQLSAYSIVEGALNNLIDEYNMIDSTYLDEISDDISQQFSGLLEIESEM